MEKFYRLIESPNVFVVFILILQNHITTVFKITTLVILGFHRKKIYKAVDNFVNKTSKRYLQNMFV